MTIRAKRIWQWKHTKRIVAGYYTFVFGLMAFYLVSVTFEPEKYFNTDNWFLLLSLFSIYALPFTMREMFDKDVVWENRALNWMYWANIIITGISGIVWYLYPTNPRLEPATLLLGFSTAVIVYTRERGVSREDKTE